MSGCPRTRVRGSSLGYAFSHWEQSLPWLPARSIDTLYLRGADSPNPKKKSNTRRSSLRRQCNLAGGVAIRKPLSLTRYPPPGASANDGAAR